MANLISPATAFLTAVVCLRMLQPLAVKIGLVDTPRGRKQHEGHIPLIGGIAMFLGFLFGLLTLDISLLAYRGFIAGAALLVFVGVLDDFHELSARARFIAQTVAGLMMVLWGKVALHSFGNLFFFGNISLGILSAPVTVIAVIGIINAINMTDGVDGLAGGLTLIAFSALAWLALEAGAIVSATVLSLIAASLLAFLCFNYRFPWRRRALIFMGDAGSMFLGFALVWFLVELSQGRHRLLAPAAMLWIIALPLFDIIGVIIRRLQTRRSVFSPDREHLHYLLKDAGLTTLQVTLIMHGAALALAVTGIFLSKAHIAEGIIFLGFLCVFAVYLFVLSYLRKNLNGFVK